MSKAEHDEKGAKPDSKTEEGAAPSKADLLRIQLKHIAHYATVGFAPIVSAAALAVAIVAVIGNQSAQEQLGKATAKLEAMGSTQPASKAELEKIKVAMAQEETLRDEELKKRDELIQKLEEERKKQEELLAKIIQSVSQLQKKSKIAPTLEDQLRQATGAPAAAAAAPATASVAAPAKAAPPAAPPKPVEKKFSPQVQSMKEAIEQYNK